MYMYMCIDALHIHFSVCFTPPPLSNTVYADGSICLDILQNRWSPTYDVSAILTSIQVHTLLAEFVSVDVGRWQLLISPPLHTVAQGFYICSPDRVT